MQGQEADSAASICSDVARRCLGRYRHALDLLPLDERRRSESLCALVRGLFHFAREPGFGAERLAKMLLWQDRLDEALETGRADEPIFANFATQDRHAAWDRQALARLQEMLRSLALTEQEPASKDLAATLWTLALGRPAGTQSILALARLLDREPLEAVASSAERELPTAWRQAYRYCRLASRGRPPGRLRRAWIRTRVRM